MFSHIEIHQEEGSHHTTTWRCSNITNKTTLEKYFGTIWTLIVANICELVTMGVYGCLTFTEIRQK